MPDKKCFVVMGFGVKTDYRTSRALDLDKTYKFIIKPAVEGAGLECIRADEIPHSGTIDIPMYEHLLDADLVVADLSTSNVNAAFELGVRYGLRPRRTIVIAETQFEFPFDVNHISILTYRHDGKALDIEVALDFRQQLQQHIENIMNGDRDDSPVYTFLKPLNPPAWGAAEDMPTFSTRGAAEEPEPPSPAMAPLMEQVEAARAKGDFQTARSLLEVVRGMAPRDPHILQQLALATYKSKNPDPVTALERARELLSDLDPMTSNDAETLGLWGAIHKQHWELSGDREQLDRSIAAYEKGYQLLGDYYNGINYAFLLNVRSSVTPETEEAVTDFVLARRVRTDVVPLCDAALKQIEGKDGTAEERYWLLATKAEALFGLAPDRGEALFQEAEAVAPAGWMTASTRKQLDKLKGYIESSPLDKVRE